MDEETKKAIDGINVQIHVLASMLSDNQMRLTAVQELAITLSAFSRLTESRLAEHLNALSRVAAEDEPATKPAKRGPEVG